MDEDFKMLRRQCWVADSTVIDAIERAELVKNASGHDMRYCPQHGPLLYGTRCLTCERERHGSTGDTER